MASSSLRFVSALAELVRRSRVFSFQCSVAESSPAPPRGDVQYRPFTGKMKDSELDLDHRIPAGNGASGYQVVDLCPRLASRAGGRAPGQTRARACDL